MARPSPSSVMMDWEKMFTCWYFANTASSDSEPRMERMPTISGMPAATTPPKTNSRITATKMRPTFSARAMSPAMPSSSASATAVAPAICTVAPGSSISTSAGLMARRSFSVCSPSPLSPMAANALVWSSLTSCGFGRSK